jgi:predicted nucleotidyltransferase component of viral defense system
MLCVERGHSHQSFCSYIPRLSVDIDLVYLPMDERSTALGKIRAALSRISALIMQRIPGARVQNTHEQSDALRLIVVLQDVRIKIELSPVIRGTVFPERIMSVSKKVEEQIGYAEIAVVSLPDLYAGKICAALDRQHPRDLFDVKFLLENEGFTDDFRKTFLVYLISHQRPMAELLQPNRKDITKMYEDEFVRMTQVEVPIGELEEVRERLITEIHGGLTADEKKFLLSFKAKSSDWRLLGLQNPEEISNLPSVRWKMSNLEQMPVNKHQDALKKLQAVLQIGKK